MKIFIKPAKICLIVGCAISRLLIDYFYKNWLIGFKEIIDYLIIDYKKINRASLIQSKHSEFCGTFNFQNGNQLDISFFLIFSTTICWYCLADLWRGTPYIVYIDISHNISNISIYTRWCINWSIYRYMTFILPSLLLSRHINLHYMLHKMRKAKTPSCWRCGVEKERLINILYELTR